MCAALIQSKRTKQVPCPCPLCNGQQRDKRTAVSHALRYKCSPSVLEESDRRLAEVEGSVEGGMTTVNDSHPVEEEGMIIDNGHPDEYETQHTSFEDSLQHSQQDHTPCPSQRQLCQKGNTSRHTVGLIF